MNDEIKAIFIAASYNVAVHRALYTSKELDEDAEEIYGLMERDYINKKSPAN